MLPGMEGTAALALAESLRLAVAALGIPHAASTVARHLTLSAGVATLEPTTELSPADLVAGADRASLPGQAGWPRPSRTGRRRLSPRDSGPRRETRRLVSRPGWPAATM